MKGETRMKKQQQEISSIPASSGSGERGITRKEFLKGTAGFVLLCGSGFGLRGLAGLFEPQQRPVGPQLREGLTVLAGKDGARVTACGKTCFTVNEAGRQLLSLADGRRTLSEIIAAAGMEEYAESVADFYLALGRAGYLTTRLEVNKIAVSV